MGEPTPSVYLEETFLQNEMEAGRQLPNKNAFMI